MNPTLPPGLASPVPIPINNTDFTIVARRVCYVPFFEDNRGIFSLTVGEFVDTILQRIELEPDDKVPPERRIQHAFSQLVRMVQYYASLKEDNPEHAALLRRALDDPTFELPSEAEMKARRPNGNGLSAHP